MINTNVLFKSTLRHKDPDTAIDLESTSVSLAPFSHTEISNVVEYLQVMDAKANSKDTLMAMRLTYAVYPVGVKRG